MDASEFDEWREAVSALCEERFGCSWDSLCGDSQPLEDAFRVRESPLQFVERWRDKYDLIDLGEVLGPPGRRARPEP